MAEHTPTQEGIKKLQEEITCPLCLDDFDDPKRLPCGHIYCKVPCLQGLLLRSMNSTVICPECRSVAQVPANDLDNLPNAFHINRLKQVYRELCKANATLVLPQGTTDHPCPNHPSQSQDVYCETCQELICRDCIVVAHQHQEPKYRFVKDVAAEQKQAVLNDLVPVETFAQQATDALSKIEEVKREVVNQKDDLTQKITASFDALHHVLEEQKQILSVRLQEETDLKLATIELQQQEIEKASSKLQQVIESVCIAATHGHKFLAKKPQLTDATSTLSQVSHNPAVEPDLIARVLPPAELKQACVSTNYVRKGVPDPQRCTARGGGLKGAEINTSYIFAVHVANVHGVPCSAKVSVELKTLQVGAITQPQVTACSPSHYKVSYTPTVRGRHELSIKVNGEHITDSPFKIFVRISVSEIKYPVAEITDMVGPTGLHSTAESILVCDHMGYQVAVYDHCSFKRVATVGSHLFAKKLKKPAEITTDSQLNIYVTTGTENSLLKFKKDGTYIKTVTGTGRRGGQFDFPSGMCITKDRVLYVCDSNNSRVLAFDLNLKYLSQVRACFVLPSSLDADTSGKLYICDHLGVSIKVLAPNGHHLHTISHYLSRPVNVRIFGEVLYVSDQNRNCVSAFTLSGEYIGLFGQEYLESPEGLAIDKDGYFYISSKRQSIIVF